MVASVANSKRDERHNTEWSQHFTCYTLGSALGWDEALRVWFKFRDLLVEFVPMTDGVDCLHGLREWVAFQYLNHTLQDQVKFYASPAEQRANRPLNLDTKVDGLGLEIEHPILVDAPFTFGSIYVCMFGLRPDAPRLERDQLLNKINTSLTRDLRRFVLLAAPHGSGKRSILLLFAQRYPELHCIDVMLMRNSSPNDALRQHGLDICGKESSLSEDEQHVILIEDAQRNYEDKAFWKALITEAPSWLPSNIRFIISASHALESPIELQSIRTFGRTDFLLSDEEAREFLALPGVGLPEKMKDGKDKLAELLVRECGGLVGALRVAVTNLSKNFRSSPTPSESELLSYVLSYDCLECMERCFCRPTQPTSSEFLMKCLALSPNAVPLSPKIAEENKECFMILKKTGVLVQENKQLVRFSSPMAERFYFKRLVPRFAHFDPKSVRELITKVLGSLSASALRASVDGSHGFPDEITFRQQLMKGIALNTTYTCSTCPELPRVFPVAATDNRGVVFFVNASQKWGLEFFVDGGNAQDYTSQFAPGDAMPRSKWMTTLSLTYAATPRG
ncbi:hypothetical protein PF010_g25145 [Phytophthora fragariae]|uniref:Uncharacterized protein n=2 Tax=Phytophthora fragariae TaxID=53985 RepID=A0A6G0K0J6_9STRA|nr:hypothetical protein PF010_g25145 [Phytophthora fragariae]